MQSGAKVNLTMPNYSTVHGQNVHSVAGISSLFRVLSFFAPHYANPLDCPFYVSLFYCGLPVGKGTIGCIPVDTNPPVEANAGERPMFGAPVMGLSSEYVKAVPVKHIEISGGEKSEKLIDMLAQQASEMYSPPADYNTMRMLMSFWQPCEAPEGKHLSDDYTRIINSECTWAFDNPDDTAAAVKLYKTLAEKFNEIQERDPRNDGTRMHAYGQFLSASLRSTMPAPKKGTAFQITSISNLRQAVQLVPGMSELISNHAKMAHIDARREIPSDHHVYKCESSLGLVHSFNVQLQ